MDTHIFKGEKNESPSIIGRSKINVKISLNSVDTEYQRMQAVLYIYSAVDCEM